MKILTIGLLSASLLLCSCATTQGQKNTDTKEPKEDKKLNLETIVSIPLLPAYFVWDLFYKIQGGYYSE